MKNLFLEIFQKAQTEDKPVSIRTNREKPTWSDVGYVSEFNEKIIRIKAISKYGVDDGMMVLRLKNVFGVEFNDRYLHRMDLLYKSETKLDKAKSIDFTDPDSEDEDAMVKLLKQLKKHTTFIAIDFEYDLMISGYISSVNDTYFQIHLITDDGDEDGIGTYKIEDIERISVDGIDERKAEFYYQNKKKLNKG